MYPANITRSESQTRASVIKAISYQVEVDVSGKAESPVPFDATQLFPSATKVRFTSANTDTFINLIADQLLFANLDGKRLPAANFHDDKVFFSVDEGEHELEISALCRYSRTGEGLHRFVDPVDDEVYLYTQHEPADARRVFACFEQPDEKAVFEFSIVAPKGWTVLSNSPAVEPVPVSDDAVRFDFAPTKPISSYITAIIAGRFHTVYSDYTGTGGEVPMSISCRQSLVPYLDSDRIFETTKNGFSVYEEHFGCPYPFADYAQVFVPEFNAGAMENAGCVTHRDEYIFRSRVPQSTYEGRDNTILHELAHMWFGDLVTMTWWDDLWLNESFAEWASHFCQDKIRERTGKGDDPWATFANNRKNWAYRQDQLPTTHPIAADMVDLEAVELNFDGITYAKGASTLKQLVAFVGEEAFLDGVRKYFNKHAWGNTELNDLLIELEASSGRDLSRFSQDWLETPGVNTLQANFDVDAEGRFTCFEILQSAIAAYPVLRQHHLAIGLYDQVNGKLTRTLRIETDIDGASTPIPELIGVRQPALILINDDDLTYAKIRLDSHSLQTLTSSLKDLDSTVARALCWGAAWDMCRDAELPAADYVELVLAQIAAESDTTAVSTQLNQALSAINYFSPRNLAAGGAGQRPANEALLEHFANGLYQLLMKAEPGSDHQLAFARAFISCDKSAEGAWMLQRWLFSGAGAEVPVFYFDTPTRKRLAAETREGFVPDGLEIDTDLRWRIVAAQARLGNFTDAEIAAEAEMDNTAAGAEKAAGARASQPLAEAKAAAWQRLVLDADTPNETHYQIAGSFFHFGQEDVLLGYLPKYQAVVEAISSGSDGWAERSSAIRQHIVGVLFPAQLVDGPRLSELQKWFASGNFSNFVKRAISERLDEAERGIRCREAQEKR
ncbi:MAG: aminopeptidase N [Propionibacteriaceae bacterium]|jgi:aminopeptidase N|nr:aminopeptidase N [Propionibacteriaceae bacterium]